MNIDEIRQIAAEYQRLQAEQKEQVDAGTPTYGRYDMAKRDLWRGLKMADVILLLERIAELETKG